MISYYSTSGNKRPRLMLPQDGHDWANRTAGAIWSLLCATLSLVLLVTDVGGPVKPKLA
jgi:hypothetical protein